ncbi:hypothetical protein SRB5_04010 [Streptomyces sp. RB5]|uniref:Uncharacterized protein n=1 Tax=Streptomyces smaragdinus TaxID=2585196 RepID=A0A7K0CC00_9ACTN|nr:hypothetical protein [Streptomyces smaragdinus]MQY10294.1 hypothetical protein [Streptomyces smaragdinus]
MITTESSDCPALGSLLGRAQATAVQDRLSAELVASDLLAPDRARSLVCARACAGDPLLLAAPGQIWVLDEDIDIDDAPALRLAVHARLSAPPRVIVSDADEPGPGGALDELLLEVLEFYRLESWQPDLLPATPGTPN